MNPGIAVALVTVGLAVAAGMWMWRALLEFSAELAVKNAALETKDRTIEAQDAVIIRQRAEIEELANTLVAANDRAAQSAARSPRLADELVVDVHTDNSMAVHHVYHDPEDPR